MIYTNSVMLSFASLRFRRSSNYGSMIALTLIPQTQFTLLPAAYRQEEMGLPPQLKCLKRSTRTDKVLTNVAGWRVHCSMRSRHRGAPTLCRCASNVEPVCSRSVLKNIAKPGRCSNACTHTGVGMCCPQPEQCRNTRPDY